MKITEIKYTRSFGGGKGRQVEEYGKEEIGFVIEAVEGEEIQTFKEAIDKVLLAKKGAYKVATKIQRWISEPSTAPQ